MPSQSKSRGVFRIVFPLMILAVSVTVGAVLLKTPPQVSKGRPASTVAVVGVMDLAPSDVSVFIEAYGTVIAAREVRVQPQVSGRVATVHPDLTPGGIVHAGDVLIKVDQTDYELAESQARFEMQVAELQAERLRAGTEALRHDVQRLEAELEYMQWNADRLARLSERDNAAEAEARDARAEVAGHQAAIAALEARIIEQEKSVEVAVAETATAENRLAMARIALSRTRITAPFDAIVVSESVEPGQLVGPQTVIATLAATETFWVRATVPQPRLADIRFAGDVRGQPSQVTVTPASGTAPARPGLVLRPLGALDPQGRMAQVLIAVRDPLGLQAGDGASPPPILIGGYVRVAIDAGTLDDVVVIPRVAARENDRVWVRAADHKLAIRPVEIVWRRQDDVLVRDAFEPGDQLVITQLASVVPGMPLDIRQESSSAGDEDATTPKGSP